jgi:hypothetical protein
VAPLAGRKTWKGNELHGLKDPKPSSSPRTVFEVYPVRELEKEVERGEREILERLEAEGGFVRTRIRPIDYLVDQIRFLREALAQAEGRGLQGIPAVEWAEYLSWPECWRVARTRWRRDLLRREAFEERSECWQGALRARHPGDSLLCGPPRQSNNWPPSTLRFGPYPSLEPRGKRQWHPQTPLASISLEAQLSFNPWTRPNPLQPVRRLSPNIVWTITLSIARKYGVQLHHLDVLIDEPRDYSSEEVMATLHAIIDGCGARLRAAETSPSAPPDAVLAQLRRTIDVARVATERIGQAKTNERAAILERLFRVPGTIQFGPIEIIPEDLPPEWLGVFLGFALCRKGVLSTQEQKRLSKAAVAVLGQWQVSKRFRKHELDEREVARIVKRLANMRRLLQAKSLFLYLAKAVRGVERDRQEFASERDLTRET